VGAHNYLFFFLKVREMYADKFNVPTKCRPTDLRNLPWVWPWLVHAGVPREAVLPAPVQPTYSSAIFETSFEIVDCTGAPHRCGLIFSAALLLPSFHPLQLHIVPSLSAFSGKSNDVLAWAM